MCVCTNESLMPIQYMYTLAECKVEIHEIILTQNSMTWYRNSEKKQDLRKFVTYFIR